MNCRKFEELEDLFLLGELDKEETTAMEQHLAGCPHCSVRQAADNEVLGKLFMAVQPAQPPAGVKTALLEKLVTPAKTTPIPQIKPRPTRLFPAWAAGIAAVLLVALAIWTFNLQNNLNSLGQQRVQAQRLLEYTAAADTWIWTMFPEDRNNPDSPRARMYVRVKSDYFIVTASKLPPAEPGKVYRLWMVTGSAGQPRNLEFVTNLVPDNQGQTTIILSNPGRAIDAISCFVTLESPQNREPLAPKLLVWNQG